MTARTLRPASGALVLATALILLAGCRPSEPRQIPAERMQTTYQDAARGSAELAGMYTLRGIDHRTIPAPITLFGGCRVFMTDGILTLAANGQYSLSVVVFEECNGQPAHLEDITFEGFYSIAGSTIRFGDKVLVHNDEPAPEVVVGDEDVVRAVFPNGRLAAMGTLRSGRLSFTLENLRTLHFQREGGPGQPVATG